MNSLKVAKILSYRSPNREVTRSVTTLTETYNAVDLRHLSAPYFDGILFGVPGRGGCKQKGCTSCESNCAGPPKVKKEEQRSCEACGSEKLNGCEETKVKCPPPGRPPQPCQCMKVVSYPPLKKNCPGPCPRPVNSKDDDCD